MKLNKVVGIVLIVASPIIAFYKGKEQGWAECVDFSILPILSNSITVLICGTLLGIGL